MPNLADLDGVFFRFMRRVFVQLRDSYTVITSSPWTPEHNLCAFRWAVVYGSAVSQLTISCRSNDHQQL